MIYRQIHTCSVLVLESSVVLSVSMRVIFQKDDTLHDKRQDLIEHTAKLLDKLQMIRYNEEIGKLSPTGKNYQKC